MSRRFSLFTATLAILTLAVAIAVPPALAQHTDGRINVTVTDPQGAVVTGAALTLIDAATNDTRKAVTSGAGTYTFVNLDIGTYKLQVTQAGFAAQSLDNVIVQATKTTDVQIHLTIGAQVQSVQVEAVTPVIETTSNAIGTVIDPNQIETLPITGRDLTQLSHLTPGYSASGGTGMWAGQPLSAQGNNIDGIVGSPSRMKFGGNAGAAVSPRLENIEEMTVQTDQLDMNQGFGQAAMQLNYITRRGSNAFHGRAYEDFRNDWLNANSWSNNARGVKRARLKRNEFGGSVGGPVIKDKLFFFASLSTLRQPGSTTANAVILTPSAQAGNYTYRGSDGTNHTVNVFNVANSFNNTLPNTVNSVIATQMSAVQGSTAAGTVTATSDPIVNNLTWLATAPTTAWYPTLRMDYNASRNVRMNLAINRTQTLQPGANLPFFPGSSFQSTGTGNKSDNATVVYGVDWTVTPHLINQFKAGWLYNTTFFSYNTDHSYIKNPINVSWQPTGNNLGGLTTPQNYSLPITPYYPVINVSDTLNWQHGAHNFSFGYSFIREQDHYWNPPEGIDYITLGLAQGDPALDSLTNTGGYNPLPFASTTQQAEAQSLYALLTGRVSSSLTRNTIDTKTQKYQTNVTAYNLDELSKAWGLFAQDSWRLRPNFTVNLGLRWDFTGDNHDLGLAYHNVDTSSVFGPTATNQLFTPGALNGNSNPTIAARPHAYNSWNVSPQPAIGFAWNPQRESGLLSRLLGKDATVIRAGYSLRKFTVPYQYFWDNASDYGTFFYQFATRTGTNTPGLGNFKPGSVALGQTFPAQALSPAAYVPSIPASAFTFVGGSPGISGMKYNIDQPYIETWDFGIQRRLGTSRVLEVRYNGNRSLKQWININSNEVNIFENGFLKEFANAQKNYLINCQPNPTTGACAAGGTASFGNLNPAGGTVALPILTAAFTGTPTGAQTNAQFRSGTFITALATGAAGDFARRVGANGAAPFFCNLVGTAFSPCATNAGFTGAGNGYPINFFVANPYAITGTTATGVNYMTDAGYSTYNSMQVDFRQQTWHGVQADVNYTWSKNLGILPGNSGNDWTGAYTAFTLRNLHDSYVPSTYDIHHVIHANATADLPVGKGKLVNVSNGVLDRIVGGWNVGTIAAWQSGLPGRLTGGFLTYNNIADSGLTLNGVTRDQLQSSVGVHRVAGTAGNPAFVTLLDPKYLSLAPNASAGGFTNNGAVCAQFVNFVNSNCAVSIQGSITPGQFSNPVWIYGPHGFFQDMMVTKNIPITERIRFNLQGEFLNVWNHPVFGQGATPISGSVRGTGFGTVTGASTSPVNSIGARQVELRANIVF